MSPPVAAPPKPPMAVFGLSLTVWQPVSGTRRSIAIAIELTTDFRMATLRVSNPDATY
jgi:hypothetical protein